MLFRSRKLTRLLRTKGAQNGVIVGLAAGQAITPELIADAVAKAKGAPSMAGQDLAQVVTRTDTTVWDETEWKLSNPELGGKPGFGKQTAPKFHVVAYDFGVKRNILRLLSSIGAKVTVVPAKTSAEDILAMKPDGVFLSNGPGDPAATGEYAVPVIKKLIDAKWEPLLITPPFPEYPSGHSTESGAAAAVLTAIYGEDFAFTDRTHVRDGLGERKFASFRAAADEAGMSRMYGGIHFRPAIEQGLEQGRCIAQFAIGLRTRSAA